MQNATIKVSAPGSLMLTGEHAVLRDYPALVAAVNLRMHVEIQALDKKGIIIDSDKFGSLAIAPEALSPEAFSKVEPPFHFIANVLAQFSQQLNSDHGIKITINSEFSPTLGLGSSAALTVALLYGLLLWFKMPIDKKDIALQARDIIQSSQNGMGSGADVMASVFGGVVYYQMNPLIIECLDELPPLVTVYSGSKTPTPIVIAKVNEQEAKDPELFKSIFKEIGNYSQLAREVINKKSWPCLGHLFSGHALLQEALGVATPLMNEIQNQLKQYSSIYGAKISGSGLGDCVIAVGHLPQDSHIDVVNVSLSQQGVRAE
jgi:mevalonate kinase